MLRESGVSSLANVATSLSDSDVRDRAMQQLLNGSPAPKPTDLATIRLGTDFPVEDDSWHDWWGRFRSGLRQKASSSGQRVSFATGDPVDAETTHPKLTRLTGVGLSQPFAPIITFDKPAFESYGLSQAENAAMDVDSAKAYVTALDDLLENSVIYSWRRPKPGEPKQLSKDFVKLGGSRLIYWYDGPSEARTAIKEENDFIAAQLGGTLLTKEAPPDDDNDERVLNEGCVRASIRRVKTGEFTVPLGDVRFCIIALSGAGGRVMVRDFVQGSLLDLAAATERWFDDLALVTWRGQEGGDPKLEQVLTSPLALRKPDQDYLKWVATAGTWRQQLWRAALLGRDIPQAAVSRALLAYNRSVVSGDLTDSDSSRAQAISRVRLALVKADLIRRKKTMTPALDPEHPSTSYHCGRLLALYDNLQRAAQGDVGAGVVQRFYGGAITNPSGVFAQLSRLAMMHLNKLGEGLANLYESRIAEIHNAIKRDGDQAANYPSALNQDEQAMFALGFWHQTAFDNAEKAKNVAAQRAARQSEQRSHE